MSDKSKQQNEHPSMNWKEVTESIKTGRVSFYELMEETGQRAILMEKLSDEDRVKVDDELKDKSDMVEKMRQHCEALSADPEMMDAFLRALGIRSPAPYRKGDTGV